MRDMSALRCRCASTRPIATTPGLAELARMGWNREANVKSTESRYTHSLLAARAKLVDLRRDVENQMRGLLKGLGLPAGKAGIKALLDKIVVIMREAPHLRMLFTMSRSSSSPKARRIPPW
jgi:transposase